MRETVAIYRDGSAAGRAVTLWRSTRWNTAQIAEQVGLKEHQVCRAIYADASARRAARQTLEARQ